MSQAHIRSGESEVGPVNTISAAINRLQSEFGETISPKEEWRALLDEVRISSERIEQEVRSLGENRELLLAIIDLIPVAFFVKDHRSRFFLMNRACEEQWGMSFSDLRDTDASQIFPPDQMKHFLASDRSIFEGRQPVEFEEAFWSAAKQENRTGYTFKRPMYDADGNPQYLVCVTLDITDRKLAEEHIRENESTIRGLVEQGISGIFVADEDGKIAYVNPRFAKMIGYDSGAEFIGHSLIDFISDADKPAVAEAMAALLSGGAPSAEVAASIQLRRGGAIDVLAQGSLTTFHGKRAIVGVVMDVTERKKAQEKLEFTARHDALTGLANRQVFMKAVLQAIARADRAEKSFAVLYLDLDHFKDVNDTLGHPAGDALLCEVAGRIQQNIRETDLAARFGGDEFAVLTTSINEPADAANVADKIVEAVGRPIFIEGSDIRCDVSIGISVYEGGPVEPESMLSQADVALYQAKSDGRATYRFFTDSMEAEVRTRVAVTSELREAIPSGQLFLLYQPQIDSATGRIIGVELLVRWRHPTRGVLPPSEFIPIAEKSNLIVAIDHWVNREACRQAKAWMDAGLPPLVMSVNVSGAQFRRAMDLENDVAVVLANSKLPPQLLELELTETILMEAAQEQSDVLARLRRSGVKFAIDDFGTGYSSLDYLRRFPVDRIKIAQVFVAGIETDPSSAAIVRAIIALARELSIVAIAEGVETARQVELLKGWGCPQMQGYYFARPLVADDFALLMRGGEVIASKTIAPRTAA